MNVPIPGEVSAALDRLRSRGFQANPVGGCVRDSLLGMTPEDWDLCTSAKPEETLDCFSDCTAIPTGLRHGTVTVLWQGRSLEITTYRRDGAYSDHRRPDGVDFVGSLEEDLARRDFTVNAMALSPGGEVIDPFGGREDLERGLLRCVGEPERRFREDALRILRLVRFASRLGFSPEQDTLEAGLRCRDLLTTLAGERILREVCLFLEGKHAGACFPWAKPILEPVLPELADLDGAAEAAHLDRLPPGAALGLGLLLRSPEGEKAAALRRLKSPGKLADRVRILAEGAWGPPPSDPASLGLCLGRVGEEDLRDLLRLWHAMGRETGSLERELEARLEAGFCFAVKDLPVSGEDLQELGFSGKALGRTLDRLLREVQAGALPLDRAALLTAVKQQGSPRSAAIPGKD